MTETRQAALGVIERQVKELDEILAQALRDLNTVACKERLTKWKLRTTQLLAQHVGTAESRRFSQTDPGPSFTNDMVEEITEDVETYRKSLLAVAKEFQKAKEP